MDTQPKKRTILIVEDEIPLLTALRDKLVSEGFAILEAINGKEGLELALSAHPDLILLDIILPIMDGIAVLKKLHADAWGRDAKVIMLTNLNDNEMLNEAIAQGSHDYLIKSDWKIENVVKVIRDKLKD